MSVSKTSVSVLHFFSVFGAGHEVFIQRVPPLATVGPVTHGGWEGELITSYIPKTPRPMIHL